MTLVETISSNIQMNLPDNISVVVRGFSDKEHFGRNAFTKYRAASLIKVPLAIALFDGIESGVFDIHDTLVLQEEDKVHRPEDQNGRVDKSEVGTEFTVDYLVDQAMTRSDNTAANMLISYVGMDYVNTMLQEFGYVDTVLARKMCDKHAKAIGEENFTNPSEITQIFHDLHTGAMINPEHSQHLLGIMSRSKFHDKLTKYIPKDIEVPRKGGVLDAYQYHPTVVHDVGLVKLPETPYVIGVFVAGIGKKQAKEHIAQISGNVYHTITGE
jgi:beta-lactamase class A